MTFEPGEYKTRDGRTAKVVFQVSEPNTARHPLVGEVQNTNGEWAETKWCANGDFYVGVKARELAALDLMPPEQRQHTLVKVYRDGVDADGMDVADLTAMVTVTYTGDQITGVKLADKPVPTEEEDDDNG